MSRHSYPVIWFMAKCHASTSEGENASTTSAAGAAAPCPGLAALSAMALAVGSS